MATRDPKTDRFDLWLSRLVRLTAAVIGLGTFIYEVLKGENIEFGLIGLGIAGLPLGGAIENVLEWVASLKPTPPRPRKEEE